MVPLIEGCATRELRLAIASQLESSGKYFLAGKQYLSCEQYPHALNMFMKCPYVEGQENEGIELAIQTIGQAKNATLTYHLIDYLMGVRDGVVKVICSILISNRMPDIFSKYISHWLNIQKLLELQ